MGKRTVISFWQQHLVLEENQAATYLRYSRKENVNQEYTFTESDS